MNALYDHNGREIKSLKQDFALPSVLTHAALFRTSANVFLHEKWDEALRDSRENALAMRRDCWLQSLVEERVEGTVGCKWHLETDNPKDRAQQYAADIVTKAIKRTHRLRLFLRQLMDALWYGRFANQVVWGWEPVGGRKALVVKKFQPVNGDKIGWSYDTDTPHVLVDGALSDDDLGRSSELLHTNLGQALVLKGTWRERFLLHHHKPQDADFFEGEAAGAIKGTGIRSAVYWMWFLRDEFVSYIADFLERSGLGIVVVRYEQGNAEAKTAAEVIAKTYSRRTVITMPAPPGSALGAGRFQGGPNGIEVVETPTAGVEVLKTMIEWAEERVERYIVGQTLSADHRGSGGLGGSGAAEFQQDTKRARVSADSEELAESLTGSDHEPGLVNTIFKWTLPELYGKFRMRWVFDLGEVDPGATLEAVNKAFMMGVPFLMSEVRQLTGLSDPGPDDEVISSQQQQQAQMQMQAMGGMPGGGPPGAGPGAPPPGPEGGPGGQPPGAPPGGNGDDDGGGGGSGWHPAGTGPRGGRRWRNDDGWEYRGKVPPGQSEESQRFAEHLAQFGRGDADAFLAYLDAEAADAGEDPDLAELLAYAQDDPELLLYGAVDWTGPHAGPHGGTYWINVHNQRKVYAATNPGGRGDAYRAKLEENRKQKTAAADAMRESRDKHREKRALARQQAAEAQQQAREQAKGEKRRQYQATHEGARQALADLVASPDPAKVRAVMEVLQQVTVRDMRELKRTHGIRASGIKGELARKIAERALGVMARAQAGQGGSPSAGAAPQAPQGQPPEQPAAPRGQPPAAQPPQAPKQEAPPPAAQGPAAKPQGKGLTHADLLSRASGVLGDEEVRRLANLPIADLHKEYGRAYQAFRGKEADAIRDVITARTTPGFVAPEPPRERVVGIEEPPRKMPWERRRDEYVGESRPWRAVAGDAAIWERSTRPAAEASHRRAVEQALAAGETVPPEVLADYPDLARTPGQPEPPAPAPQPPGAGAQPRADALALARRYREDLVAVGHSSGHPEDVALARQTVEEMKAALPVMGKPELLAVLAELTPGMPREALAKLSAPKLRDRIAGVAGNNLGAVLRGMEAPEPGSGGYVAPAPSNPRAGQQQPPAAAPAGFDAGRLRAALASGGQVEMADHWPGAVDGSPAEKTGAPPEERTVKVADLIPTQPAVDGRAAARGKKAGLVDVIDYGGKLYVDDGHHRLVRAAAGGAAEIRARVYPGARRREIWERPVGEFRRLSAAGRANHRAHVEDALRAGKPVPPEVLADYPDLAAPPGQRPAAQPAPPSPSPAVLDHAGEAGAARDLASRVMSTLQRAEDEVKHRPISDIKSRLDAEGRKQAEAVRQHFAGLAGRVRTAADAKKIAAAYGLRGATGSKEQILRAVEQAILGRIGAFTRPYA